MVDRGYRKITCGLTKGYNMRKKTLLDTPAIFIWEKVAGLYRRDILVV